MSAPARRRGHLHVVSEDGPAERDPRDPDVWRGGLSSAREALSEPTPPRPAPPPITLCPCVVCGLATPRTDEEGVPICVSCQRIEEAEEDEEADRAQLEAARRRHPSRRADGRLRPMP